VRCPQQCGGIGGRRPLGEREAPAVDVETGDALEVSGRRHVNRYRRRQGFERGAKSQEGRLVQEQRTHGEPPACH
jgi:hypothetical protein